MLFHPETLKCLYEIKYYLVYLSETQTDNKNTSLNFESIGHQNNYRIDNNFKFLCVFLGKYRLSTNYSLIIVRIRT